MYLRIGSNKPVKSNAVPSVAAVLVLAYWFQSPSWNSRSPLTSMAMQSVSGQSGELHDAPQTQSLASFQPFSAGLPPSPASRQHRSASVEDYAPTAKFPPQARRQAPPMPQTQVCDGRPQALPDWSRAPLFPVFHGAPAFLWAFSTHHFKNNGYALASTPRSWRYCYRIFDAPHQAPPPRHANAPNASATGAAAGDFSTLFDFVFFEQIIQRRLNHSFFGKYKPLALIPAKRTGRVREMACADSGAMPIMESSRLAHCGRARSPHP